jgi:hypothetical protein
MKCKFRTWAKLDRVKGEQVIVHCWYCKTHKLEWSSPGRKKAKQAMKLHKKEAKHA